MKMKSDPVEDTAPVRTTKRKTMDEQDDDIEQLTQRKKAMTVTKLSIYIILFW